MLRRNSFKRPSRHGCETYKSFLSSSNSLIKKKGRDSALGGRIWARPLSRRGRPEGIRSFKLEQKVIGYGRKQVILAGLSLYLFDVPRVCFELPFEGQVEWRWHVILSSLSIFRSQLGQALDPEGLARDVRLSPCRGILPCHAKGLSSLRNSDAAEPSIWAESLSGCYET